MSSSQDAAAARAASAAQQQAGFAHDTQMNGQMSAYQAAQIKLAQDQFAAQQAAAQQAAQQQSQRYSSGGTTARTTAAPSDTQQLVQAGIAAVQQDYQTSGDAIAAVQAMQDQIVAQVGTSGYNAILQQAASLPTGRN